jgi:hypothetical protein
MVLDVALEVLGQIVDACGQQGPDLGRAGVALTLVIANDARCL